MAKLTSVFNINKKIIKHFNERLLKYPVGKRLNILVIFSIISLTLVGSGGWIGIWRMDRAASYIANQKLPAAELLSNIRGQTAIMLKYTLEVSNRVQDIRAQRLFKKAYIRKGEATKTLKSAMADFEKLDLTDAEKKIWNEFKGVAEGWLKTDVSLNDIIKELADNRDEEIQNTLFGKYKIVIFDWIYETTKFNKALNAVLNANIIAGQKARESSILARKYSRIFMLAIYGLTICISLLLSIVIVISITKPLYKMRGAIVNIADNNDFTLRADISSNDEAGQTGMAFNGLLVKVQQSLNDVLKSTIDLSKLAGKAQDTSERVSEACVKQSESASVMASAIQQLTASAVLIDENMHNVIERSNETEKAADTGSNIIMKSKDKMENIVETVSKAGVKINELGTQADKISDIMQVINEVADKTKLLSLNAAIEASRAGSHGRGFAVVAEEVSTLAKRTRDATIEVSEMITAMQNATAEAVQVMNSVVDLVHDGKKLSDEASGYIVSIQTSAGRVMEAINEISEALNKQGISTQDITLQVDEVMRMIENNTESSGETARVSLELNELSESLLSAVNQFKV